MSVTAHNTSGALAKYTYVRTKTHQASLRFWWKFYSHKALPCIGRLRVVLLFTATTTPNIQAETMLWLCVCVCVCFCFFQPLTDTFKWIKYEVRINSSVMYDKGCTLAAETLRLYRQRLHWQS